MCNIYVIKFDDSFVRNSRVMVLKGSWRLFVLYFYMPLQGGNPYVRPRSSWFMVGGVHYSISKGFTAPGSFYDFMLTNFITGTIVDIENPITFVVIDVLIDYVFFSNFFCFITL